MLAYIALSLLWMWTKPLAGGSEVDAPWQWFSRALLAYGLVILSTVWGVLTTRFVHQGPGRTQFWLFGGGITLLVMALLDVSGARWRAWTRLSTVGVSSSVGVLGWVLLSGIALLSSWNLYRETWRPLHRNRIRYWILASLLCLSGKSLFVLLDYPYCATGTVLHLTGTAAAIVALLAHRLPDLGSAVRQGLKQVLLAGLTALFFGTGIGLSLLLLRYLGGLWGLVLGTAGTAIVLALSYPSLQRHMRELLDRFLFGERYDPQKVVQDYSQGISNIVDLYLLARTSMAIIGQEMDVLRGTLIICERESAGRNGGWRLRPIQGLGTSTSDAFEVSARCPVVLAMVRSRAPLFQYDIDLLPRFRNCSALDREWFSGLGVEVYAPIHAQGRLLGILALGAKASGEPFTSGDIALLRTLADQTAVALENARLVADLRQLNAEITGLNQELTQTNERLAILDRQKSDFISISSHELKTPLTQVKGYADLLLQMSHGKEDVQYDAGQMAEGIIRGVRRLQTVVEAMLDVSLIEAEAFAVHPGLVSLRQIILQVVESLEPAFKERHLEAVVQGLDALPLIMADSARLYQALRNVVINAIKFTPDEGRIAVRAALLEAESMVEVTIADSGIGIDPEHHDLIFEKFYRIGELNLHSSGQTKFKGAGPGLGLPIARGIVEAHGGRIWVESEGQNEERTPGSTFHILLPVGAVPERQQAEIV
jgi:signal transduction histidine kinase